MVSTFTLTQHFRAPPELPLPVSSCFLLPLTNQPIGCMIHHLSDTDGPPEPTPPPSQLLSWRLSGSADAAVLTRAVCPQAEGGTTAGAVATVMAVVDLARVLLPGQAEGGGVTQQQEEENEKQEELQAWQLAGETQLESPAGPGPVWVSQVRAGSVGGWDSFPGPDPFITNQAVSLTLQAERAEALPRIPHFTVSKVSVSKLEPSHEVRGWR